MTVAVGARRRSGILDELARLGWLLATVFTNRGQEWAAGRLAGTNANTASYIGWGTGSGGGAGSTGLVAESTETRVNGTVSVSGSGSSAAYQTVGTMVATAARAITEVGNFETVSGSDIVVYSDFAVINLSTGDGIEFTISIDPE